MRRLRIAFALATLFLVSSGSAQQTSNTAVRTDANGAAVKAGALSQGPTQACPIVSENFDELTPQLDVTSVGPFHAIDGTNVDIVGDGIYGELCQPPTSGYCIDLDGTGGDSQGVLQTVNGIMLQPGTNYYLSFDLIGSQRFNTTTSTTVDFGPYHQTFVLASNDLSSGIVSNALVTVTTETMAFLTFTSNTRGNMGALLDNVSISEQTQ